MSETSSSDEDDIFLRLHAKAIAEALQEREASERAFAAAASGCGTAPSTSKSQREQMIHDTYVALCYDDPRVESDFACTCLATALLDSKSPYALSGPLVEGIKQLSLKQQEHQHRQEKGNDTNTQNQTPKNQSELGEQGTTLTNATTCTSQGTAILAWAIHARIPHLLCQASTLDEVHAYLGSYRPPPPPHNLLGDDKQNPQLDLVLQQQKNQDADRLAALLTQPISSENQENSPEPLSSNHDINNNTTTTTTGNLQDQQQDQEEDEVWAAESDPSDFEFESGFTYEQQMADLEQSFSEWMIDRTDPLKLSQPPSRDVTTWKHVRHAVMELTSQFTYRQVASLFVNPIKNTMLQKTLTGSPSQTLSDVLGQLTLTLLIPPTTSSTTTSCTGSNSRPSIFDSPDDEHDFLQPQRQLQVMAWYPLWVMRDAAAVSPSSSMSPSSSSDYFSHYLTLLQNLISIDAASHTSAASSTTSSSTLAPATYVGLASLSSLCQQFVVSNCDHAGTGTAGSSTNNETIERFRSLRLTLWETCDDVTHALEKEEGFRKAAAKQKTQDSTNDNNNNNNADYWIEWTLLPFFEIITNQRLQDGTTIVVKVESIAQRHYHHQQTSQRWAGLLQSGLFRHLLVRLQALQGESLEESVVSTSNSSSSPRLLWQLMRRSLFYMVVHSMAATSALGKYAWRYPGFAAAVEIGESYSNRYSPSSSSGPVPGKPDVLETFTDKDVDDILWNLLSMELAGTAAASGAPTIQWKTSNPSKNSSSSIIKPLPSRAECQLLSLKGFQRLCQQVVRVLQLACQEENKKENIGDFTDAETNKVAESSSPPTLSQVEDQKIMHQLVLRNFHRLVNTIGGCPLLAKLFVQDLEETAVGEENTTSISKCLDSIQEALSQYKGPPPVTLKAPHSKEKDDDDDDESKAAGFDSRRAKEQIQNAGLQEDIHMVRKVLKMLRTLMAAKATTPADPAATASLVIPLDLTSSSKTD